MSRLLSLKHINKLYTKFRQENFSEIISSIQEQINFEVRINKGVTDKLNGKE